MKEPHSELGQAIRIHRLAKGLTQKELAKKTRVDISLIKNMESKVLDYNFLQRLRLLVYLGIDVKYIGRESLRDLARNQTKGDE